MRVRYKSRPLRNFSSHDRHIRNGPQWHSRMRKSSVRMRHPQRADASRCRRRIRTAPGHARGGLLPHECHQAGFSYEEGKALGFKRKIADWISMELAHPYNKW